MVNVVTVHGTCWWHPGGKATDCPQRLGIRVSLKVLRYIL